MFKLSIFIKDKSNTLKFEVEKRVEVTMLVITRKKAVIKKVGYDWCDYDFRFILTNYFYKFYVDQIVYMIGLSLFYTLPLSKYQQKRS